MKHRIGLLITTVALLIGLVVVGCAQPAPSPKPSPVSPSASPAPLPKPSATQSPSATVKLPQSVAIAARSTTVQPYRHWVPIAEVISKYSGMKVEVKPLGGHEVTLPMMIKGDIDFVQSSGLSSNAYYTGSKTYWANFFKQIGADRLSQLRLVTSGPENTMALYVRPDRGIKTWADLAGKKIYSIMPGGELMMAFFDPLLDYYGLNGKVTKLQMSTSAEGQQAVTEGKADGWLQSVGPQITEVRAALGDIIVIPVPDAALAALQKVYPAFDRYVLKTGTYGVKQDVPIAGSKSELLATSSTNSGMVYAFLKAMYGHYDEYKGANPDIDAWSLDTALKPSLSAPVQEGAIKFFKEMGVWNADLEKQNAALLAK